jgi:activating signal cointegrator 1
VKGLTLLEPWASLVAAGYKRIETRSWSTEYRGELLIHASASKKSCRHSYDVGLLFKTAGLEFPEGWPATASEYPLGRIVAVARLIDCAEMTEANIARVSKIERAFGDWRPKRFAWILATVRRTEQIPWKGALGLWDVPQELEARVAA